MQDASSAVFDFIEGRLFLMLQVRVCLHASFLYALSMTLSCKWSLFRLELTSTDAGKPKRSHHLFGACWIQTGVDSYLLDMKQVASWAFSAYTGHECSQTSFTLDSRSVQT